MATESNSSLIDYRQIFNTMQEAFALHEIVVDDCGRPSNYKFLAINPAFEKITGLKAEHVIGRDVKSLLPTVEDYWIDVYGKVATTGQPTQLQQYSRDLGKFLTVSAYCPNPGQFACLFMDATEETSSRLRLQEASATASQTLRSLRTLREVDKVVANTRDLEALLPKFLNICVEHLSMDAGAIILCRPGLENHSSASQGFDSDGNRSIPRTLEMMAWDCVASGRVATVMEGLTNPCVDKAFMEREGMNLHVSVPLVSHGSLRGVLELFSRRNMTLDTAWLEELGAMSSQLAIGIETSMMIEELHQSNHQLTTAYDGTLFGWSKALDLRDKETEGHSSRVTENTMALAQLVGFSDDELTQIRRGAMLHDVGKIAIPDKILLKPGPLSDEEWGIMRLHPVYAHEWLSPIEFLREASVIPYCHHERWDGTGYPRKLKGEDIPLPARVFAIIDVWDALTSDRPYRTAWSQEKALDYISGNAGIHFDPGITEIFVSVAGNQESY